MFRLKYHGGESLLFNCDNFGFDTRSINLKILKASNMSNLNQTFYITQTSNYFVFCPQNGYAYFNTEKQFIRWADESEWNWATETWEASLLDNLEFSFPEKTDYKCNLIANTKEEFVQKYIT